MGKPKVWVRRRKGKGRKLRSIIVVWEKLPEVPREQKSFKRDAEAAEEFAAAKRLELRTAGPLTAIDRKITVRTYGEKWLADLEKASRVAGRGLKHQTLRSYQIQCEVHIYPAIGEWMLRDIHQQHVESLLTEKMAAGLSRGTVHTIYSVLRRLFQRAKHQGVIQANPVSGVWRELPGMATKADGPEEQRRKAMSFPELGAFLAATTTVNHVHASLWYVVAKTGLRFGEALALRVGDVDVASGDLAVRRSLDPEKKGRSVEERTGSTKTKRTRAFEMGVELAAYLVEYLAWRKGAPADWLFPGNDGLPVNRDTASWTFGRIAKAAGLGRRFSPHSLRHTYASQMLMKGAPLLWVAKQLGHSPEMCLRAYAWALPAGDRHWSSLLDGAPTQDGGDSPEGAPENSEPFVTISEEERSSLRGETVDTPQTSVGGKAEIHSLCGTSDVPNKGDSGCRPDEN